MVKVLNNGTGAGGSKTNLNGKLFEKKTENESRLISNGFVRYNISGCRGKFDYYLEKIDGNKKIVYLTQGGLKSYFSQFFKKELFRCPDEAYLIYDGESYTLKILEKKNQNVAGSVDTKLLAGIGFIEEYQECLGSNFNIKYAFCISEFLQKDYTSESLKYSILRKINEKHDITVLFGDDDNYYNTLDYWISS